MGLPEREDSGTGEKDEIQLSDYRILSPFP